LDAEKAPNNQNDKIWSFCQVRFGRFDNPFDSIDNVPIGDGGPPWSTLSTTLAWTTSTSMSTRSNIDAHVDVNVNVDIVVVVFVVKVDVGFDVFL